ncbi:hypothetical protein [Magnetospira sp. QH-2]|uniref:hypothetical protein n=1 Tax=Magnetospira sp. (strain QH-2) TaxID=1288970 RepID=UPI0003E8174A|nr:hypothetical protein [Magnetospira sp. QH-2]CCQ74154.1 Protein of unknown function [Magnetospira sp. QH-2]
MAAKQPPKLDRFHISYRLADDRTSFRSLTLHASDREQALRLAHRQLGAVSVIAIESSDETPPAARFIHGQFLAQDSKDEGLLYGLCS